MNEQKSTTKKVLVDFFQKSIGCLETKYADSNTDQITIRGAELFLQFIWLEGQTER